MHKLALVLLNVFVLTQISHQNPSVKPSCGIDDYVQPCCLQVVQILASATACAKSVTETYAAAYASVHAATQTAVSSLSAAAAANQIAIQQSVALAARPGRCCEINAAIVSNVSSYGGAITKAAAEAKASAQASAEAAAVASATAKAAAEVYAVAQTVLASKDDPRNPSCCEFAEEILSAVQIVGKFVADAKACAEISTDVAAKAKALAQTCSEAEASVTAGASTALSGKINSCCDDTYWSKCAKDTARAFDSVTDFTKQVNTRYAVAFDNILAAAEDFSKFKISATLVDNICNNDCSNVSVSCNKPGRSCCSQSDETVCFTTKNVVKALLETVAAARAVADASVYAKSVSTAIAAACTSASSATAVATRGYIAASVKRSGCCQVKITVDSGIESYAKVVSSAIATTRTAAEAYANGYAYASACSQAIARASASASAFASAFRGDSECCNKACSVAIDRYVNGDCCKCSSQIANACSSSRSSSVATAVATAISFSKSIGGSTLTLRTSDAASVVEVSGLQYSLSLSSKCCCCSKTAPAPRY